MQKEREKNIKIPILRPLIIGLSGIGKSELTYEIALKYTEKPYILPSTTTQEEIIGTPKFSGNLLEYILPIWTKEKIVVLEEFDFGIENNLQNSMQPF